jgi:hypothetical protein
LLVCALGVWGVTSTLSSLISTLIALFVRLLRL